MKAFLKTFLIFILVLVGAKTIFSPRGKAKDLIGKALSELPKVYDQEDYEYEMSDLLHSRKKMVVFWTTWCGYCLQHLKEISKAIDDGKYDEKDFLFVNTDETPFEENKAKVKQWMKQQKTYFKNYFDENNRLFNALYGEAFPYSAVVDGEEMKITWSETGTFDINKIEKLLSKK